MKFEEVAHLNSRDSCTPDISHIQKIFRREYSKSRYLSLDEILVLVLGEHEIRGGGRPEL